MALPKFARAVHPGEAHLGIDALQRRLMALGDLPVGTEPSTGSTVYRGALVNGVKRFQRRHGLAQDGDYRPKTRTPRCASRSRRVSRQIQLALERLRWLPHLGDDALRRSQHPDVPLVGLGRDFPGRRPAFGMDVIVGRALIPQTPVFVEQLRQCLQAVLEHPVFDRPR